MLIADRHLPLIDAYVENRNAVIRYGRFKHVLTSILVLTLLQLPASAIDEAWVQAVVTFLLLTFAPDLCVSSGYRQTFVAKQRNAEHHEQHYQEMQNELQTVHNMQVSLLPDLLTLPGYTLDEVLVPANNVGGNYFNSR